MGWKDRISTVQSEPIVDSNIESLDPSMVEALLRGAAQGATFGFADEITATGEALLTDKSYEEARDESREQYKQSEEAHPGTTMLGNIAGGLVIPGLGAAKTLPSLMKAGAIAGGVGALGVSETDVTEEGGVSDLGMEAIKGAALGGGVGLAGGGATAFIGKKVLPFAKSQGMVQDFLRSRKLAKAGESQVGLDKLSQARDELTNLAKGTLESIEEIKLNKIDDMVQAVKSAGTEEVDTIPLLKRVFEHKPVIENKPIASEEVKDVFDYFTQTLGLKGFSERELRSLSSQSREEIESNIIKLGEKLKTLSQSQDPKEQIKALALKNSINKQQQFLDSTKLSPEQLRESIIGMNKDVYNDLSKREAVGFFGKTKEILEEDLLNSIPEGQQKDNYLSAKKSLSDLYSAQGALKVKPGILEKGMEGAEVTAVERIMDKIVRMEDPSKKRYMMDEFFKHLEKADPNVTAKLKERITPTVEKLKTASSLASEAPLGGSLATFGASASATSSMLGDLAGSAERKISQSLTGVKKLTDKSYSFIKNHTPEQVDELINKAQNNPAMVRSLEKVKERAGTNAGKALMFSLMQRPEFRQLIETDNTP